MEERNNEIRRKTNSQTHKIDNDFFPRGLLCDSDKRNRKKIRLFRSRFTKFDDGNDAYGFGFVWMVIRAKIPFQFGAEHPDGLRTLFWIPLVFAVFP
jgi:hypothetical protein